MFLPLVDYALLSLWTVEEEVGEEMIEEVAGLGEWTSRFSIHVLQS